MRSHLVVEEGQAPVAEEVGSHHRTEMSRMVQSLEEADSWEERKCSKEVRIGLEELMWVQTWERTDSMKHSQAHMSLE